jgi:hypothetical protein
MKGIGPIVLAGFVALFGVASCSSSTSPPRGSVAWVTGFASIAPIDGIPSGPVAVRVTGTAASRLAVLVSQLPSVSGSQVHCEEPLGLIYSIAFSAGAVGPSKAVVEGYRCAAAVTVAVAGEATSWRQDSACMLIRAVRQVLPSRAKATRGLTVGCDS